MGRFLVSIKFDLKIFLKSSGIEFLLTAKVGSKRFFCIINSKGRLSLIFLFTGGIVSFWPICGGGVSSLYH